MGQYKTDSTKPVKILKGKSFIAYRTPNPAARILLIHRIKSITKKGTMDYARSCLLIFHQEKAKFSSFEA